MLGNLKFLGNSKMVIRVYHKSKNNFLGNVSHIGTPYSIKEHYHGIKNGETIICDKNIVTKIMKLLYKHTIFLEDILSGKSFINMSGHLITIAIAGKKIHEFKPLTKSQQINTYEKLIKTLNDGKLIIMSHGWFTSWYRKDSEYPANLIDINEIIS